MTHLVYQDIKKTHTSLGMDAILRDSHSSSLIYTLYTVKFTKLSTDSKQLKNKKNSASLLFGAEPLVLESCCK